MKVSQKVDSGLQTGNWKAIAKLWHDYDPIGVFIDSDPDNPCPDDEYDNYAQPTLDLLNNNASRQELFDYVAYVTREYIGMDTVKNEYIDAFVDKLLAWKQQR